MPKPARNSQGKFLPLVTLAEPVSLSLSAVSQDTVITWVTKWFWVFWSVVRARSAGDSLRFSILVFGIDWEKGSEEGKFQLFFQKPPIADKESIFDRWYNGTLAEGLMCLTCRVVDLNAMLRPLDSPLQTYRDDVPMEDHLWHVLTLYPPLFLSLVCQRTAFFCKNVCYSHRK